MLAESSIQAIVSAVQSTPEIQWIRQQMRAGVRPPPLEQTAPWLVSPSHVPLPVERNAAALNDAIIDRYTALLDRGEQKTYEEVAAIIAKELAIRNPTSQPSHLDAAKLANATVDRYQKMADRGEFKTYAEVEEIVKQELTATDVDRLAFY